MTNIEKIQRVQLNILKEILKLIERENLTYIAVGGTALGAFRHKGMIPWDDDIDIAMPRKDYQRLLELQHLLPEHLFIQNFNTDSAYPLYFTKIRHNGTRFVEKRFHGLDMHQGIFIDIFPLDNITDRLNAQREIKIKDNIFRRLVKKQFQQSLYCLLYGFKSKQESFFELDKLVQVNNNKPIKELGSVHARDYFTQQQLNHIKQLEFEDIHINVIVDIEDYLFEKYGDYMRIPEEHERRLHKLVELDFGTVI